MKRANKRLPIQGLPQPRKAVQMRCAIGRRVAVRCVGFRVDVTRSLEEPVRAFAPVAWYELGPAKGRVKAVSEPPGAWPLIQSQAELEAYFGLPDAEGRIWYYSLDLATRSDKPVVPPKAYRKP